MRLFQSAACLLVLLLAFLFFVPTPSISAQEVPPVDAAEVPALVPLTGIRAIDTGDGHACALTSGGGVLCWGNDEAGQIGDGGDASNKLTPVGVTGLDSGVQAISAGFAHTCALTSAGGVLCWGFDSYGQVGDGADASNKLTPVGVTGLNSGVQAISAGEFHTCALTSAGGVLCWGLDGNGQIGDGADASNKLTPVGVTGLNSGVQAISAGEFHTCALTSGGGVLCWGLDSSGQIGDGADNNNKLTPVGVTGLDSGVQAVSAGYSHTCALTSAGGVLCWGRSDTGQVGDGDPRGKHTPIGVAGLTSGVQAISAGGYHTCALTSGGGVLCWGYDGSGQVGDGANNSDKLTPVDVAGLNSGVQAISAGGSHTCALTSAGGALCWGYDLHGQVGDGAFNLPKLTPINVLVARTCFKLARSKTGSGSDPVASEPLSPGCPLDHYTAGATLYLQATPLANQRVQAWGAPVAGGPGDELGVLTMPAADTTVTVTYAACRVLTLSRTGAGAVPQASPGASVGCAAERFAAGEKITLVAVPNAGQRVKAWVGAGAVPATGSQVNTLAMPAADKAVSVQYEACFALTTAVVGGGQITQVAPAASAGCVAAATYASGEGVTLAAEPAAGFTFAGWSGGATGSANPLLVTVTGPLAITATFAPVATEGNKVFLPTVRR